MIGSIPLTVAGSTVYGPALPIAGAHALQFTVSNGAVIVQFGTGPTGHLWTPEAGSFRIPGVHVIPGRCDAIRVRSAVAHDGTVTDPWPTFTADAYA